MIKAIVVGLGIALSSQLAFAQPAPAPAPGPEQKKPDTKTDEKAGSDESLSNGGDSRPWAAGVSVENQKIALQLFQDGNVQLNDGLFLAASKLYREALSHWPHPAIYYNLALALLNLDQPIEVYESLQKAVKYGAAPLEKDKFEHAKEYTLLVEKQIATVNISCSKPGAKISVDGKEVFTVPPDGKTGNYVGRVKIGKHTFVAEKPGYNAQVDAPFIGPGETYRLELTLYTAEELTRYKRKWDKKWVPYAVIGGGAVLGVLGGVFQLSAKTSYSDYDAAVAKCNESASGSGCMNGGDVANMKSSGDTKRMLGYVGYGMAGAAVITGAVLVYLNRSASYQITADEYRRELREKEKVSITPVVAPGMAGAMLNGSF